MGVTPKFETMAPTFEASLRVVAEGFGWRSLMLWPLHASVGVLPFGGNAALLAGA